jgi:transposase
LSEGDEYAGRGSEEKKAWFVEGKKWLLIRDNAPVHISLLIHDFLTKHEMTLIPKPPYSPDIAPTDLCLHLTEILTERTTVCVC